MYVMFIPCFSHVAHMLADSDSHHRRHLLQHHHHGPLRTITQSYSFEALPALFTVVQGLLAHTADAHFLVLYSSRGKRLDDRLPEVAAAHGFDCSVAMHLPPHATTAPPSASDDQSPDEPMRLCTFTRKTRA